MEFINRKCKNCKNAFQSQQGLACRILSARVSEDFFCASFSRQTSSCELCGNAPIAIFQKKKDGTYAGFCENCFAAFNTCRLCANAQTCRFETDPSPLPKVVVKTIQQGNMRAQTQVRNPERIELCCRDCNCGVEQNGTIHCNREATTCNNYKCIIEEVDDNAEYMEDIVPAETPDN